MPCCARLSYIASLDRPSSCPGPPDIVPIGHISVMPQPWTIWRPWRSPNASSIARGGAAPPTVIDRIVERSQRSGAASSAWRMPIQIVGTPALSVTLSCSNASRRLSGSRWGPGKHLLRADEAAGEREAPCVRVEHRNDGQDRVALVHAEEVRGREGVECDRAMRVDDALRQARGAAREAHRRRRALVEVAIGERALVGRGDEILVVDRALGRVARADRDHVLEADAVDELRGERPQHLVDHEHAVARVRGDVRVVVGVQAEVQRVRDEAADRRADVRLEMLVVVPHQRGDAVAVVEAEAAQRDGEALGA